MRDWDARIIKARRDKSSKIVRTVISCMFNQFRAIFGSLDIYRGFSGYSEYMQINRQICGTSSAFRWFVGEVRVTSVALGSSLENIRTSDNLPELFNRFELTKNRLLNILADSGFSSLPCKIFLFRSICPPQDSETKFIPSLPHFCWASYG